MILKEEITFIWLKNQHEDPYQGAPPIIPARSVLHVIWVLGAEFL